MIKHSHPGREMGACGVVVLQPRAKMDGQPRVDCPCSMSGMSRCGCTDHRAAQLTFPEMHILSLRFLQALYINSTKYVASTTHNVCTMLAVFSSVPLSAGTNSSLSQRWTAVRASTASAT
jgi:hypothetical protein